MEETTNQYTETEIIDQWFREQICNRGIDTPTYNLIFEAIEDLKTRFQHKGAA